MSETPKANLSKAEPAILAKPSKCRQSKQPDQQAKRLKSELSEGHGKKERASETPLKQGQASLVYKAKQIKAKAAS